ncbi:MAG TPA: TfoX/Sxy family protein [Bacteroidales bacterium]|nr:TfoX/Sxy family protein [Bacteroidales bacterium]
MAYNEYLAERIKQVFARKGIDTVEKKMMGGICYMVNDKMCAGVIQDRLMARLDPDIYEEALNKNACRPMDFTGKTMKGFVFVEAEGIDLDEDLEAWIQLCLDYNPKAKSSKKKIS